MLKNEPHVYMIRIIDQIIPINGMLKNSTFLQWSISKRSNNTNKWNAQEPFNASSNLSMRSNNTNKWNAQERLVVPLKTVLRSNNTNKWNAQEPITKLVPFSFDQIIPINGMLKNLPSSIAESH